MAQRVIESAHARAMAEEARAVAAQCHAAPFFRVPVQYDPEAAVRAAEGLTRRLDRQRVMRADKLAGLRDAGKITPAEHRAGQEIRLVVDFVGVLRELKKALQFDSQDVGGVIEDIEVLQNDFLQRIGDAERLAGRDEHAEPECGRQRDRDAVAHGGRQRDA
jgi:hypothetical protein